MAGRLCCVCCLLTWLMCGNAISKKATMSLSRLSFSDLWRVITVSLDFWLTVPQVRSLPLCLGSDAVSDQAGLKLSLRLHTPGRFQSSRALFNSAANGAVP